MEELFNSYVIYRPSSDKDLKFPFARLLSFDNEMDEFSTCDCCIILAHFNLTVKFILFTCDGGLNNSELLFLFILFVLYFMVICFVKIILLFLFLISAFNLTVPFFFANNNPVFELSFASFLLFMENLTDEFCGLFKMIYL